jgi:hypothetical protein
MAITLPNDASTEIRGAEQDQPTLATQVAALIERLGAPVEHERRREPRIAIPVLFQLTPLDTELHVVGSEPIVVVGKNISRRGISFFHERPITFRRARIEVAQAGFSSFVAEVDVRWCRFRRPGWYESGGRLLRASGEIGPIG